MGFTPNTTIIQTALFNGIHPVV